jgi:hypothetical protein
MVRKIFFFPALIGLLMGLTAHLMALFHFDAIARVPFIWLLHIGIFVVFIPGMIGLFMNPEFQKFQGGPMVDRMNPLKMFKAMFGNVPKWLFIWVIITFIYAFINFTLFAQSQTYTPSVIDGQYVLHNHGKVVQVLTEAEYYHQKTNELRGFSGHWVLFYSIAAALLFPFTKSIESAK